MNSLKRARMLLILSISIISGCGGIPIKSHPTDDHFVKKEDANDLVGESRAVILQKYGEPDWEFTHSGFHYFLYTSPGEIDLMWDIFFPYIVLPGSLYDADYHFCALLKFDKSEELVDVQYASDAYYDVPGNLVNFCLRHLFPKDDAESLEMKHEHETQKKTGTDDR